MAKERRPRIVVGVDGSIGARVALAWALEEARLRGAELDVVHSWEYLGVVTVGYVAVDPRQMEDAARLLLGRVVEEVGAAKDRDVHPVLVEGPAARSLLDASEGADLLVVGSRGRGGFAGLLLGSVSRQVTHHAHCPVVVVPTPEPA